MKHIIILLSFLFSVSIFAKDAITFKEECYDVKLKKHSFIFNDFGGKVCKETYYDSIVVCYRAKGQSAFKIECDDFDKILKMQKLGIK